MGSRSGSGRVGRGRRGGLGPPREGDVGRRLAPVGGAVDEAHELTALRRSVSHVNSAPYRKDVCCQCDVRTFSKHANSA